MNAGKLSEAAFKRSVVPCVKRINAGTEGGLCMRTAVITGNEAGTAYLAAARALNALAAAGAETDCVTVAMSIPKDFGAAAAQFASGPAPDASENAVKQVMAELEKALAGKKAAVSDIACEVTDCSEITVSVTAAGHRQGLKETRHQNIVMVGYTAAVGSAMLSMGHKDALLTRYTKDFLAASDRLMDTIDIAGRIQAVIAAEENLTAVEPVSDGGVFGAIWSLCDRLGAGCEIDIKSVPIKQATVEVSEFFDVNPYILRGDGAFLYVTDKDADAVTDGLIIGHLTEKADRVVINGEIRSFLTPVREDSYFECKER